MGRFLFVFFDVILDRAPTRAAGDDELMHFRMRCFWCFFDGLLILSCSDRLHVQWRARRHHIVR